MPFIHKEKKSQEKMYVVVDLNHAGPKLLNQLYSAIQGKKDKCALRFQKLDSGQAVIYLKNLDKVCNLSIVKNNQKNNEQRKEIKKVLRESIKNCEKYREFVSDIDFNDALKNINELVNLKNHDIKVGELKRPLRIIADVVSSPLKRKKLAEIKTKNKIRSSISQHFQENMCLHLKRFLHMDEAERKNLHIFLNERAGDLGGQENNIKALEIKSMQKFITDFMDIDDLDKTKLLNRFSRSKSMIEIEKFCRGWLVARRSDAELTHRMKSELFGWRKEMDFIAINVVNRNENSEVKKINRAVINSKNLLVPPISPLGREVFKVGGKNHSSATRNEKSDERTETNKISRVLKFSLQDNEESSIVESSEQSNAGNI